MLGTEGCTPSTCTHAQAPWEKQLWRRQPYPDNYVDASFLSQLRTNATAEFPSFVAIALSSLGIMQQLASVLLFVAVFAHVHAGTLAAHSLVCASVAVSLALTGAALCVKPQHAGAVPSLKHTLPSLVVLALTLQALTPVLRTLGEATSSDSIWAFAAVLFAGHLALADYTMQVPATTRPLLSSALSLNLAMCASVVLSSRLAADADVFALLLFALQLFAIFPLLRMRMYTNLGAVPARGHGAFPVAAAGLTAALVGASTAAMLPHSRVVAFVLQPGCIVFLSVLCPWSMRRAQRWKREMRGPWDEAVPQRRSADFLVYD
ncbi:D-stereospecific aminopeptidase [Malassezia sp. CBS 17886]|nr:D-stereospecific aminopeptidase [Malassezia sp. CBS 17886]